MKEDSEFSRGLYITKKFSLSLSTLNRRGSLFPPTMTSSEKPMLTDQCSQRNNQSDCGIKQNNLPVDCTMHILFTGFFNGFNIEINSQQEMALLYHMGFFGKGSASRSKPQSVDNSTIKIIRRRQFVKRTFWYKKFCDPPKITEADLLLKEIENVSSKLSADIEQNKNKDIIDLVSSDEEMNAEDDIDEISESTLNNSNNVVVVVPNSDSEGENYFENFQPKSCVDKINLKEKLLLSLQEAFFLMYGLGCLRIVDKNKIPMSLQQCWHSFIAADKKFLPKYIVYHYFRSKGYVVKPGIKFGGDYLLYKDGPGVAHADFIVVIKHPDFIKHDWIATLAHVRMAGTTVKEVLIAEVVEENAEIETSTPTCLNNYSIREIILTRNIPMAVNTEND